MSVSSTPDGTLEAKAMSGSGGSTFIGDLPAAALDPVLLGHWRHFKGGVYEFVGLVATSPDGPLVLYRSGDGRAWLRPLAMIHEVVEYHAETVPRFVRT
jgi:hypothetical protein